MKQYILEKGMKPLVNVDPEGVGDARGLQEKQVRELQSWASTVQDRLELTWMNTEEHESSHLVHEDGRLMEGYLDVDSIVLSYWAPETKRVDRRFDYENYPNPDHFYEQVSNYFDSFSTQAIVTSPSIQYENLKKDLNTPHIPPVPELKKSFILPEDGMTLLRMGPEDYKQLRPMDDHEVSQIQSMAISVKKHLGLTMYAHPTKMSTYLVHDDGRCMNGEIGTIHIQLRYWNYGIPHSETFTENSWEDARKYFNDFCIKLDIFNPKVPPSFAYGEWTKEDDGEWHHQRYPSGPERPRPGLSVEYSERLNDAKLTLDGTEVELTFGELLSLQSQVNNAVKRCQTENAELWKQKVIAMEQEEGQRLKGPVRSAYDLYE